jgi:hypothetical protein
MTVKSASGVALPHSASYLINAHRQLSKMQSWCLPTEAYFLYMTLWSFVVSLALSWKDPPGCSARPWTSGSQSYQDARGVSVTEVGELLWWREVLEDRESCCDGVRCWRTGRSVLVLEKGCVMSRLGKFSWEGTWNQEGVWVSMCVCMHAHVFMSMHLHFEKKALHQPRAVWVSHIE